MTTDQKGGDFEAKDRTRAEEIVSFWTSQEPSKQFGSDPSFDTLIKDRFGADLEQALEGALSHWQQDPFGSLALVILLAQFCLNIYRGHGRRYAGEEPARKVSRKAMESGHLESHPTSHHGWYFMPFMHSESLDDQDESVRLFSKPGFEGYLPYAKDHWEIVARFGRFPHRNDELGRESTEEEIHYLANGGFKA